MLPPSSENVARRRQDGAHVATVVVVGNDDLSRLIVHAHVGHKRLTALHEVGSVAILDHTCIGMTLRNDLEELAHGPHAERRTGIHLNLRTLQVPVVARHDFEGVLAARRDRDPPRPKLIRCTLRRAIPARTSLRHPLFRNLPGERQHGSIEAGVIDDLRCLHCTRARCATGTFRCLVSSRGHGAAIE